MNEQQTNETQVEELESLDEQQTETVESSNSIKYEQQANELVNSVTMADLVDPTAVAKKSKKKGLVIALVVIVLVLGVTSVLFLNDGTFSKILGITTTSELDVFKTDTTSTSEIVDDKEYGKFRKEGNKYIFDISNAENGLRLKYFLNSSFTAYIKFADDYDTSKNFSFNLNNADYYINDTNPGELSVTIEEDYIAFLNSNNEEAQVILSKKGIKLEDDPAYDPSKIVTTKATTTTTTKHLVHVDHSFENTTDENGKTTKVETEYDPDMVNEFGIKLIWYDEDGYVHYEYYSPSERETTVPLGTNN